MAEPKIPPWLFGQAFRRMIRPPAWPRLRPARLTCPSDPAYQCWRAILIQRNGFAEALEILKPLALLDHPDQHGCVVSPGLGRQSGGHRTLGVGDEEREVKLLDLTPSRRSRSILIHQPGLVRVRLELALAFFSQGSGRRSGHQPFRADPGREAAGAPVIE